MMTNQEYMSKIAQFRRVDFWVRYSLHTLGLIGNLLMFLVYSQANLRRLSVSVYFRCISIFCTFQILFYFTIFQYWKEITYKSLVLFKLLDYLSELFIPLAVWMEIIVSLDRFFTILFPFRFKIFQKRLFQLGSITAVIIFNMALYSIVLLESSRGASKVLYINLMSAQKRFIIDLLNVCIIPFVTMTFLSAFTFVGVVRAHRRIKSMSGTTKTRNNIQNNRAKLIKDVKFGVTMIILNIVFFVFMLLNRLYNLLNFNPFNYETEFFSNLIFRLVLNQSADFYFFISFYIQIAVNSVVRKELVNIYRRVYLFLKNLLLE